jgi:hypothetical protein
MDYKIRSLKNRDQEKFTELIEKLADMVGGDRILDLISSTKQSAGGDGDDDAKLVAFGISLLRDLLKFFNHDMSLWFADLLGLSIDEYRDAPFDISMRVMEQIIRSEDFCNFFIIASRLRSGINWLKSQLLTESER